MDQSGATTRTPHHAERYAARGLYIFPLDGKRPFAGTRGFHDATTDLDTIRQWWAFRPDANIGLWPGRSELLVVDVDGPIGEESLAQLWISGVVTLECQTARGRHLYFRHPGGTIGNVDVGQQIDIRCDAGYAILPPSLHPSGVRYQWRNREPIADAPPQLVEAITEAITREAAVAAEARASAVTNIATPTPDDLDRRIQGYIAKLGHRVEHEGRNNAGYQLAAWLTHDLALDRDTAWSYLIEWNAGNTPPLSTRELRCTLTSGIRHGRRSTGCALRDERPRNYAVAHKRRRYSYSSFAGAVEAARAIAGGGR